ncbi:MAG: hypothetical protein GEV06_01185 [Luteitalea sp.]|nr:hypothetical protein [Luteitalea sp.]
MRPRALLSLSLGSVVCLAALLALGLEAPAFAQLRDSGAIEQGDGVPRVDEYTQEPVSVDVPPPSVSDVDGSARLVRRGEEESVSIGSPLLAGDSIATDRGRVELVWGNGSILSLDEGSRVDLLSDDLVRLVAGGLRVELALRDRTEQNGRAAPFRVDTPDVTVQMQDGGDYRIDATGNERAGETMVAVLRGEVDVVRDGDQVTLIAGERVVARADEPLAPMTYNVARFDAFDTWVDARQRNRQDSASAEHLPSELEPYGPSFDTHGTWRRDPTYGSVWYPRASSGWRPYFDGGWRYYPTYGWTWIVGSRWGWVTHHYGRWGVGVGGAWFWIPARRWSGAWVSWAWTPSYVGWSPLGWNGRPLYAFGSWRSGYVRGHRRGYRDGYFDGRHAWSVVRWDHFGHRRLDRRYAVRVTDVDWSRSRVTAGRRLPRAVTRSYASRSVAVRRGTGTAVRRDRIVSSSAAARRSSARGSYVAAPRNSERARTRAARESAVVSGRRAQPRAPNAVSSTLERSRRMDSSQSRDLARRRAVPRADRTVSPTPSSRERRGTDRLDRPSAASERRSLRRAVPRAAPDTRVEARSRARSASPSPRGSSRARSASPSPRGSSQVRSAPRSREAARARSAPPRQSKAEGNRGGSERRAVRRKR